ncbi:hypothetical protein LCGC14_3136430 [marine sediment metagenome]|uniref:Uncharacterized protein n=1 Tax=marine sediment metagenome TaxID=412755 RepID=A0A0F8VY66_9ZZZZ
MFYLPCPKCSNRHGAYLIANTKFVYEERSLLMRGECQRCGFKVSIAVPAVFDFTPEGAACV